MEPCRTPTEKNQDYIRQRTWTQAAGDRQVKPPADAALLPLLLELVERERRKPLLRAAAAAPVTDEQVTVLNPNLLSDAVGPRDLPQRSLTELLPAHDSVFLKTTGWPCGVWRYASAHASLRALSAVASVK